MKERTRERRAIPRGCEFGTCWPTGCHSLEIQVQHVCTCYCVALMTFFFLIGLMSLSLVLRAVSYFKLVPFHCS